MYNPTFKSDEEDSLSSDHGGADSVGARGQETGGGTPSLQASLWKVLRDCLSKKQATVVPEVESPGTETKQVSCCRKSLSGNQH